MKTVKIVGYETGKLYAQGTEEDCFRRLQEKYPYTEEKMGFYGLRDVNRDRVYPEPLKIERG